MTTTNAALSGDSFLDDGDLVVIDDRLHRPCINFANCGGWVPKPRAGKWGDRCEPCRREREREQDAKRKRVKRKPKQRITASLYADPDPNHERWATAVAYNRELEDAHYEGRPFEYQWDLWLQQLAVQRGGYQSPFASPRPCLHKAPAGGTLIWDLGDCPACAHLMGPVRLMVESEDPAYTNFNAGMGRPTRRAWR